MAALAQLRRGGTPEAHCDALATPQWAAAVPDSEYCGAFIANVGFG